MCQLVRLNRIDLPILVQNLSQSFWTRIFYKKNNSKAISKLIELVSQVKISNEQIKTYQTSYFEVYKKHEERFYSNVDDLRKINDEFSVRLNTNSLTMTEMPYVIGFFGIFVKWVEGGSSNTIFNLRNEIVLKVLEYNKNFTGNPHVLQTNNLCLTADQSYGTIAKVDDLLSDLFKSYVLTHFRAGMLTDVIVQIIE
jgi:hypothetical protein